MAKKESLAPLFREQVPDTITSLPAKIMSFVPILEVCSCSFIRNWFIVKYIVCIVRTVVCGMYIHIEYKFRSQFENI
jgi:hypothetical protein